MKLNYLCLKYDVDFFTLTSVDQMVKERMLKRKAHINLVFIRYVHPSVI